MRKSILILTILLGAAALLSVGSSTSGPGTASENCYLVANDARTDNPFTTLPVLVAMSPQVPAISERSLGWYIPAVINPKKWKPYVFDQLMKKPRSNC